MNNAWLLNKIGKPEPLWLMLKERNSNTLAWISNFYYARSLSGEWPYKISFSKRGILSNMVKRLRKLKTNRLEIIQPLPFSQLLKMYIEELTVVPLIIPKSKALPPVLPKYQLLVRASP